MYSEKRKFGNLGEDISCRFLMDKGFEILERNYLVRAGEIDIVARKKKTFHFVEVKTVSRAGTDQKYSDSGDTFRAEDNLHPQKLKRISRAVEIYLLNKNFEDIEWKFNVIIVSLNEGQKTARVKFIEDIIL